MYWGRIVLLRAIRELDVELRFTVAQGHVYLERCSH